MEISQEKHFLSSERIEKFEDFIKRGLPLSKGRFEQHCANLKSSQEKAEVLKSFSQQVHKILHNLSTSRDKYYVLFFDWLPEDLRSVVTQIVSLSYPSWKWQNEPLFLGSKKQLIVYKDYRPIMQYIETYRMPKAFEAKRTAAQNLLQELASAKAKRNEMLSEDQDIEEISKNIEGIQNKLEGAKKEFFQFINIILEDFKAQPNRKTMNIKGLKTEFMKDIRTAIEKSGLFYKLRENSKVYCEIVIKKEKMYQPEYEQYQSDKQQEVKETKVIVPQAPKVSKKDVTKTQSDDDQEPSQPNKIKQYDIIGIGLGKVDVRFRIPFNNLSPINKFTAYQIDDEGSLIYNCQLKYQPTGQDYYEKMTLRGEGFCIFTIKAQNEFGLAQQHETFSCYIPRETNKRMFLVGAALDGLIPNLQDSSISSYHEQILPAEIPACHLSMREAVMAIDANGTLAMWGSVFQKEYEEQDGVILYENDHEDQFKTPVFQISPPYQIDDVKFVTKVSCGQYYYLLCDAGGKAYSFGSNWKQCLGLGTVNKSMNTFDPIQIPYFKANKIFVLDVVASQEHALALDSKGNAYSWGMYQAQVKNYPVKDSFDSIINYTIGEEKFASSQPRRISNQILNIKKVSKIRAGMNFSGIVSELGQLLMWGNNVFGQLGCGKLNSNHNTVKHILIPIENPVFKKLNLKIQQLEIGTFHCLAITKNKEGKRQLFSWGMSVAYECGHQTSRVVWQPQQIPFFKDHQIQLISAGESGSVVKTSKGLYVFGRRTFLAKDVESTSKSEQPPIRKLDFSWQSKIKSIELAQHTAAFLVEN